MQQGETAALGRDDLLWLLGSLGARHRIPFDAGLVADDSVSKRNPAHRLLTPQETGAPFRLMQSLGCRYARYANRFRRRTGSHREGRYKSSVVPAKGDLLACQRYIEFNPVQAGMVADPGQYRWSSYRVNGLGQTDIRLTQHTLHQPLGASASERSMAYRVLFRPELETEATADIGQALQLGMPLGNERFAEAICARLGIRINSGKGGGGGRRSHLR